MENRYNVTTKQGHRRPAPFLPIVPFSTLIALALFSGCVVTHDVRDYPECDDSTFANRPHPAIGEYNVYYGGFHNHYHITDLSDAFGEPEQAYRYARCVAGLDFFGLSDHDVSQSGAAYNQVKTLADLYDADGSFAAFWGFEWSSDYYGHVTVVNTGDFTSYIHPQTQTFQQLCSWLSARNCFAIFNHPTGIYRFKSEFDHFQGPVCGKFVGIELWNMYRETAFNEYYYNDGYYANDTLKGFYDEALSRGWKIGAAGGFDNHNATWGTAIDCRLAVLARRLTRQDIFDAMIARRFFSTLDKNIALSFTIAGREMGSTISSRGVLPYAPVEIRAFDGDNEVFTEVVLFDKNHNKRRTWHPDAAAVDITDTLMVGSGDYYYVKVTQEDGDEAISSPVWVSGP
jgi:hypothetical protein